MIPTARAVTVSSSAAVQLTSTASAGMQDINIANPLGSTLYLGGTSVLTSGQGFPLAASGNISIKVPPGDKVYGVSTSTGLIPIFEVQW